MRIRKIPSPQRIPLLKNHSNKQYSFDDITTFLFNNEFFLVETFPFKEWQQSPLRNYKITFRINKSSTSTVSMKDTISAVVKINGIPTTSVQLRTIPYVLLQTLHLHYFLAMGAWEEYYYNNIEAYCKTNISVTKWNSIKYSKNLSEDAHYGTIVWATICGHADREFWVKFAISLRDSLLPWLNTAMYKAMKERENVRSNTDYEDHRRMIAEGKIKQLDKPLAEDIVLQLQKPKPKQAMDTSSFTDDSIDYIR